MVSLSADYRRITSAPGVRNLRADMRRTGALEWARWVVVVLALAWVAGVIALALISVAARRYAQFSYDAGVAAWVQQLHGTPLAAFINFSGDAQTPVPGGITSAIICAALLVWRFVREVIALVVGFGGADMTHLALKSLVNRMRPHGAVLHQTIANLGQSDYPSGHAAHAIAFYGFLAFLCVLALCANPSWWRWLIVPLAICAYFFLLVGPSRVLEGLHWPSDVLAGYLDGALWLVVAIVVYHLLAKAWVGRADGGPAPMVTHEARTA